MVLMVSAGAFAQEEWHVAAEASCAGYKVDSSKSVKIEKVKIDKIFSIHVAMLQRFFFLDLFL